MLWDIALPVLAALAQAITGFLGWRVTVDGVKEDRKRRYEALFASASLIGIVAVALAAYRGTDVSSQLTDLRQRISHTHVRMDITSLAVDDPSKIHSPPQVFTPGREVAFNVTYRNVGESDGERVGAAGDVIVTETRPDIDAAFGRLEGKFKPGWIGDEMVPQQAKFFTAHSAVLSEDDVRKITAGTMRVFVVGLVKFSDSTGEYEQPLCQWLQRPVEFPVWHGCGVHEKEVKLN